MDKAPSNQAKLEKTVNSLHGLPSEGSSQERPSVTALIPIAIMVLVSFTVYFNALWGDFVYDDKSQIVDNPWIRDVRNVPTIFTKSVWSFQPGMTSNYYRPLMHLIYMLAYHIFGLNPWGFHLVNILFHGCATVLVFLIIRRLLPEQEVAASPVFLSTPFIAAMLFASDPIHTEAVTWIAGLPDVAFAFFYLLSFYLYILSRDGAKKGYLWSILSFSMATLLKEPALTLPIMLIAYDCMLKKLDGSLFWRIKIYLPYVVVSTLYVLMRYYALRGFAPFVAYFDLSSYQYILNIFPLFIEYLTSLLWPFHLNFWHTFHPVVSLFEANGLISLALTVIFLIVAVIAYRKNKVVFLGLLFLVIPLLPSLYIKGIGGKPCAERYLYLPSVGYVLLLALFLSWAREKLPGAAVSITMVMIVLCGLYSFGTIMRNTVWRNDFNLWSDTVKKSPDSVDALNNLGMAYASRGQFDRAVAEYQIALRLSPNNVEVLSNLGVAYASQGQFDRAVAQYQEALRLKPNSVEALNNLGNVYQSQGQFDRAVAQYQEALRLKPNSVETLNNLGNVYQSQGLLDMAIEQYQTALRIKPDYAGAYNNLGNVYQSQGLLDMAIEQYQTALRLKPDYAEAHNNLGVAYQSKGLFDMAMAQYQTAIRLKPDYAEAHYNLGNVYQSQGLFDAAIEQYQTALRLTPNDADVHYNLANAYASQGKYDRAVAQYQDTLRLRPDYNRARQRLNDIVSRQR